jgi:hypothetical protein
LFGFFYFRKFCFHLFAIFCFIFYSILFYFIYLLVELAIFYHPSLCVCWFTQFHFVLLCFRLGVQELLLKLKSVIKDVKTNDGTDDAFLEGCRLCFGLDGTNVDFLRAATCYQGAADHGKASAAALLGRMYFRGDGVALDREAADAWFNKAKEMGLNEDAENGEPYAQYVLGWMYGTGAGVPQNDEEAVKWFQRASEGNLAAAQFSLGFMYKNGRCDISPTTTTTRIRNGS